MKEKKGIRVNFLGIISVLTFIVMGLGSTFAYFTATMKGQADEYVSVSSLKVILNLKIAPLYHGMEILPTNDKDIEIAYKNQCVDSRGSGACLAYTVELENIGHEQEGFVVFNATSETITNLKYMVVTEGEDYEILKGPTKAIGATSDEQLEGGIPIKLGSDENKKIVVIIWLSNLDGPQDEEQGGVFEGQASFTGSSGAKITGTMSDNVMLQKN